MRSTLTRMLISLACLPMGATVGAAADAKPASSHTTFEFRDDFQTDTRRKYKASGDIQWAKGQLTLKPGARSKSRWRPARESTVRCV
ncbi:MAG TPA: hypothetical protein VMR25_05790 [Planctomycetaceae bacterium]|nr:hypothetical protein [Planctomycetaceae bacterium]